MDLLEAEAANQIHEAIDQLMGAITELESRLRKHSVRAHQGCLRSIGIRILVSAERIGDLLTTLSTKEKLRRIAS